MRSKDSWKNILKQKELRRVHDLEEIGQDTRTEKMNQIEKVKVTVKGKNIYRWREQAISTRFRIHGKWRRLIHSPQRHKCSRYDMKQFSMNATHTCIALDLHMIRGTKSNQEEE
jgi:hypothetical protein